MKSTLIIAEAGVNHNGSMDLAKKLIDVAAECKADIVKFQTFKAELVISKNAPKAEYQKETTGTSESQLDMAKKLEFKPEDFITLAAYAKSKNIEFLSTPFDLISLDFLARDMNLDTIKVPSGEVTNAPFLLRAGRWNKKIILSTGMSTLNEVKDALGVLAFGFLDLKETPTLEGFRKAFANPEGQKHLQDKVTVLHCTTEYPTPFSDVNLRAMEAMAKAFGLPVGYSDHTPGITVPIAAVALGAQVIEKHFTLDQSMEGPDHKASLNPEELKNMVVAIRQVEQALGAGVKQVAPSEEKNIAIARRSLVAKTPIRAGEIFTEDNLVVKRPGTGVSPMDYWKYLGQKARRNFESDELLD